MERLFILICVAVTCLTGMTAARAGTSQACGLPGDLSRELSTSHPGMRIVSASDLSEHDRREFRNDHGRSCPGKTTVDFYGDGKPTLAIVLIAGEEPKRRAQLVVAHRVDENWEIRDLDTSDGTPVVWCEKPGTYEDLGGMKSITAVRPVVVFVGYGSWATLYSWDGGAVNHVQISD